MAYIKQEKVENTKAEIIDRIQEFEDEYKRYSESTVDYHYGKVEALEIAKRLVNSILTDLIEQPEADVEEVKWKAIDGYEGLYEVSTFGQVRKCYNENCENNYMGAYCECCEITIDENGCCCSYCPKQEEENEEKGGVQE